MFTYFFVVVYAPQSSLSAEVIDEWWSTLHSRLQSRGRKDTILLGDCNAKVGSVESKEIGPIGWSIEDRAGGHLRHLVADHSLFLPSTFGLWHKGPSATFFGPAGGATRLDYIAIPHDWQQGLVSSSVSGVDLLNGQFDHSGVEIRMEFKVPKSQMMKQHRACYDREAARQNPDTLACIIDSIPINDVTLDVDTHWNSIMQHCQRKLTKFFPKPQRVKRQVYFSEKTWNILNDRKDTQKEINALERREALAILAQFFRAWKKVPLELFDEPPLHAIRLLRQEKAFLLWGKLICISTGSLMMSDSRRRSLLPMRGEFFRPFAPRGLLRDAKE